ncbi:hypothetical protein Jiend_49060 [Micromonospora endophytica]|nr:hypothetical protein Jiend_49060 [Micromonospora endophytica]
MFAPYEMIGETLATDTSSVPTESMFLAVRADAGAGAKRSMLSARRAAKVVRRWCRLVRGWPTGLACAMCFPVSGWIAAGMSLKRD